MGFSCSGLIKFYVIYSIVFTVACDSDDAPKRRTQPEIIDESITPAAQTQPERSESIDESQLRLKNIQDIELRELVLDLEGDFRILKIEKDAIGNYYLALVTEIFREPAKSAESGYLLLKLDHDGTELWRFPTRENIATADARGLLHGSYLKGELVDMSVDQTGEILLTGMRAYQRPILEGKYKNFRPIHWTVGKNGGEAAPHLYLGDIAFISRIDGSGRSADSPRQISEAEMAVPLWWRPRSLTRQSDASLLFESTSGGIGEGAVMQAQILSADLSELLASACYLSPSAAVAVGQDKVVMLASSATEAQVQRMEQSPAIAYVAPPETEESNFIAGLASEIHSNSGRCWDVFHSQVMADSTSAVRIIRPQSLAAGELMTAKIESLHDMLHHQQNFDEYELDHRSVGVWQSSSAPAAASVLKQYDQSLAQIRVFENDIMLIGMSESDLLGNRELYMTNARRSSGKSWRRKLGASSGRRPTSIDFVETEASGLGIVAWLDIHANGETYAGSRSVQLVAFDSQLKDAEVRMSIPVSKSSGQVSFSSLKLSTTETGSLAVFATAGTPIENAHDDVERMEHASLFIGLSRE